MSKNRDRKCRKCAWAFADICLAYPIITRSGYYNRERAPGYKTREEVTKEECDAMFVEQLIDKTGGDVEAQQKRRPRPKKIVKDKDSAAIGLW